MRIEKMHSWNVSPKEAQEIQLDLRKHWIGEDRLPAIRSVAGADVAFVLTGSQALRPRPTRSLLREANRAIAGVIVYRFPEMEEVERADAVRPLRFPYVPGLLSFRECPVLLAAFAKLRQAPDLIFCDAHGYAHPRRFGLACHLGLLLNRATIGCAKSRLIGAEGLPPRKAGAWAPLMDEDETIGAVLRTRDGVRPIYVSQGHRVNLASAIRLTLDVCDGLRIPRPTRDADQYVRNLKRKLLGAPGR